uniref:Uncharacterized protein n=1 Tax=Oryza barthii TaxID=65489 RepID=A0A0D3FKV9_9ORYZ
MWHAAGKWSTLGTRQRGFGWLREVSYRRRKLLIGEHPLDQKWWGCASAMGIRLRWSRHLLRRRHRPRSGGDIDPTPAAKVWSLDLNQDDANLRRSFLIGRADIFPTASMMPPPPPPPEFDARNGVPAPGQAEQEAMELVHALIAQVANYYLARLGEMASPAGPTPMHSVAAYFTEALALRIVRMWPHMFDRSRRVQAGAAGDRSTASA